MPDIILASASASRLAVLRGAGVEPEVAVSGVDESAYRATTTAGLVTVLAEAKAAAVAATRDRGIVVGCDSMLTWTARRSASPDPRQRLGSAGWRWRGGPARCSPATA